MKQYTDKDQTAKLIELGFPKPTRIMAIGGFPPKDTLARYASYKDDFDSVICYEGYSIGELIEFLPIVINWTPRVIMGNVIEYSFTTEGSELYYCNQNNELIDNLFDMCIRLKEEGVI